MSDDQDYEWVNLSEALRRRFDVKGALRRAFLHRVRKEGVETALSEAKDLVALSQIAGLLRCSKEKLRTLVKDGRLPGPKIAPEKSGQSAFYSWAEMRPRLAEHFPDRSFPEEFPGNV